MAVAAKFEVREKGGQFHWALTSQGRTLATSPPYTRKVSCLKAIDSLRKAAASAQVDDTTARATTAKPAVAKAARVTGRALGKTAAATKKTAKGTKRTAKATVSKTAKAVEKTAATTARKTTPTRKRTGSR